MKRIIVSFLYLCFISIILAQTPQELKYQVVIRNINGEPISEQSNKN